MQKKPGLLLLLLAVVVLLPLILVLTSLEALRATQLELLGPDHARSIEDMADRSYWASIHVWSKAMRSVRDHIGPSFGLKDLKDSYLIIFNLRFIYL